MEWSFESAAEIYPSAMRQELMAVLHEHGAPDSDFGSAELIYGELISNAIRHARGRVWVRLHWDDDFPTLCVYDESRFIRETFELPKDPFAESGRGLFIINALARDFRLETAPPEGSKACATLPVRRLVAGAS